MHPAGELCLRLFYYDWVDSVFRESVDTVEDKIQHQRVDKRATELPVPEVAIDYLREENRVLREQLGDRRLRLNDDQRRRLTAKARGLGT